MQVVTVETPQLGDRSYLVHDGAIGVVVDPQRDWDRMMSEIDRAGVRVSHVLETHLHNDYVTGGPDLARQLGATYAVAAADDISPEHLPLEAGQEITSGSLTVRVVAAPGHTYHHLSYVVADAQGPQAVFTGGSLLFGTVGRTDLVAENATDELTRQQYHSARRLAELPDAVHIYPTHGFGSFCASGPPSTAEHSSIGAERSDNIAFTSRDEETFRQTVLARLSPYPAYYAHMSPINQAGGAAWDVQPPHALDAEELRKQLADGAWVIDLRPRRAFAQAHVPGTVGIEHANPFATYAAWLRPWKHPVVLIGSEYDQVLQAQRDLARVGIDEELRGATTHDAATTIEASTPESYPVTDFSGLAQHRTTAITVLDVRQPDEWNAGHIPGAVHLPVQDVPRRRSEVPDGQVWVHCGSGYRANIAASLLAAADRDVVLIDDMWSNAAAAGLPITTDE